jgi:hypothetical protein
MTHPDSTRRALPAYLIAALRRADWRQLPPGGMEPGYLQRLGFSAAAETLTAQGAWLVPLAGRGGAVQGHRLLGPEPTATLALDEAPRGARRATLGAWGALRAEPAAWTRSPLPLWLVEGDLLAAAMVAVDPSLAVLSAPAGDALDWLARARADLRGLSLRRRRVTLVRAAGGQQEAMAALQQALERQGARVSCAQGPACLDDPDQLARWLGEASQGRGAAPGGEGLTRLRDVLPEAFWAGPEDLRMPPAFTLLPGPGSPLAWRRHPGDEPALVTSNAFWPVASVSDPQGAFLSVAAVVERGAGWRVETLSVPRSLMHDRRRLYGLLASRGVNIHVEREDLVGVYLSSFLHSNPGRLPAVESRQSTGWTDDLRAFHYGHEPLGGEGLLRIDDDDEAGRQLVAAIGKRGDALAWRAAAEAMLADSPAAALVLAAAVASPMLRLFEWPGIGVLLGALGGAGKSSLLRLAASVYGSSGPAGQNQPAGLVGRGTGTPKGIVMQMRRLGDLPHLLDELRPSLTNPRQREELESALLNVFEGKEHARATRASTGTRTGVDVTSCTVAAGEVASGDFLKKGGAHRRFMTPEAPYATAPLGRHQQALADNFGHLGRRLVEALVATTPEDRAALRARHDLYWRPLGVGDEAPEHLKSWSKQIGTALAAIDVCMQLAGDACPDPTLWKQQTLEAWRQLQSAGGPEQGGDVLCAVEDKIRAWIAGQRWHLLGSRPMRERLDARGALNDQERLMLTPREPVIGQVAEAEDEGCPGEVLRKVDVLQSKLTEMLAASGYSAGTFTGALARRGFFETTEGQSRQRVAARVVRFNEPAFPLNLQLLQAPHPRYRTPPPMASPLPRKPPTSARTSRQPLSASTPGSTGSRSLDSPRNQATRSATAARYRPPPAPVAR